MVNTRGVKNIKINAIEKISKKIRRKLYSKELCIGNTTLKFDGVTKNEDTVVRIITAKGKTSGGNISSKNIKKIYAEGYLMSLTSAKRRVIGLTDKELYKNFIDRDKGVLDTMNIEVIGIELDYNIEYIRDIILQEAQEEYKTLLFS